MFCASICTRIVCARSAALCGLNASQMKGPLGLCFTQGTPWCRTPERCRRGLRVASPSARLSFVCTPDRCQGLWSRAEPQNASHHAHSSRRAGRPRMCLDDVLSRDLLTSSLGPRVHYAGTGASVLLLRCRSAVGDKYGAGAAVHDVHGDAAERRARDPGACVGRHGEQRRGKVAGALDDRSWRVVVTDWQ
jgi:hypothetical protein